MQHATSFGDVDDLTVELSPQTPGEFEFGPPARECLPLGVVEKMPGQIHAQVTHLEGVAKGPIGIGLERRAQRGEGLGAAQFGPRGTTTMIQRMAHGSEPSPREPTDDREASSAQYRAPPVTSSRHAPVEVRRGIAFGATAYLLWALLTLYWKALEDHPPLELIGWRLVFATALLAVIARRRGRWHRLVATLREPGLRWRVVFGGLLVATNWTAYVVAILSDRILETSLGYFMAPLGTMIIGVTVLGERLDAVLAFAVSLAAAAVVVSTVSYGRVPIAALAIAASWSVYGLLKRQAGLDASDGLLAETAPLIAPAVAMVLITGLGDPSSILRSGDATSWVLIALSGVVTVVPLALFSVAAGRVPFTILGPLQYFVPTINFALGWLAYDEELPTTRLIGFALVWCALAAVAIRGLRQRGRHHHVADPRVTVSR